MKIELKINEDIVVKEVSVKRRVINSLIKKQFEIQKKETDEESIKAAEEYNDLLDKYSAEAVGMTVEEFEDLDEEDAEKVTNYIVGKLKKKYDFM